MSNVQSTIMYVKGTEERIALLKSAYDSTKNISDMMQNLVKQCGHTVDATDIPDYEWCDNNWIDDFSVDEPGTACIHTQGKHYNPPRWFTALLIALGYEAAYSSVDGDCEAVTTSSFEVFPARYSIDWFNVPEEELCDPDVVDAMRDEERQYNSLGALSDVADQYISDFDSSADYVHKTSLDDLSEEIQKWRDRFGIVCPSSTGSVSKGKTARKPRKVTKK